DSIPEKDVFDTWFTSSSSPQLAINLIPFGLQGKLFPMSLRPQAQDIINSWLFYTMAKSQLIEGKNPWENVTISGFVTLRGEKMAKSKGNIVNPQEVMNEYGADALRYWASSSKLGEDIEYQEKEIIAGKKLVNKIINASNFVFMNLKNYKNKKPKKLEKIDDLFLDELNNVVFTATHRFENCEYSRAKFNANEFFWKNFCDKYLEIIKWRVYNGSKQEKESAFYTLYNSLLTILKLMAPFIPFITEEIYQEYFRKYEKDKSIHISAWPKSDKKRREKLWKDRSYFELGLILDRVRQEKTKAQKSMNSEIILTITKEDKSKIKELMQDLKHVTNSKEIKTGKEFKVEFI
ncbi:MAG: class I tRNA ligase family protein, partial [Nanoarchaeota archaeon]